jgi:hypothetical protein
MTWKQSVLSGGLGDGEQFRWRPAIGDQRFARPPFEMAQDPVYDRRVGDEAYDLHLPAALWAQERVFQPHPPDELRPPYPTLLLKRCGLLKVGNPHRSFPVPGPLAMRPPEPGGVGIEAVVDHLPLLYIGDVLNEGE